jgi:hypothetical protein
MRLVTFGILAVSLCAGCAVQTGDPGSSDETATETGSTPRDPAKSPAAGMQDPVGVPLVPIMRGNPDPSPWNPPVQIPAAKGTGGGTGNSSGGTTGTTGNSADEGNVRGPHAAHGFLPGEPSPEEVAGEQP